MKILKQTAIIALVLYGQSILALSARALADRKDRVMQLQKKSALTPAERAERTKIMNELGTDKSAAAIVNTLAVGNQKQDLAIAKNEATRVAQAAATAQRTLKKLAVPEETKAKLDAMLTSVQSGASGVAMAAAAPASSSPRPNDISLQQATADLHVAFAGFNGLLDELEEEEKEEEEEEGVRESRDDRAARDAMKDLQGSASAIQAGLNSIADIGKKLEADEEASGMAAALPVGNQFKQGNPGGGRSVDTAASSSAINAAVESIDAAASGTAQADITSLGASAASKSSAAAGKSGLTSSSSATNPAAQGPVGPDTDYLEASKGVRQVEALEEADTESVTAARYKSRNARIEKWVDAANTLKAAIEKEIKEDTLAKNVDTYRAQFAKLNRDFYMNPETDLFFVTSPNMSITYKMRGSINTYHFIKNTLEEAAKPAATK